MNDLGPPEHIRGCAGRVKTAAEPEPTGGQPEDTGTQHEREGMGRAAEHAAQHVNPAKLVKERR